MGSLHSALVPLRRIHQRIHGFERDAPLPLPDFLLMRAIELSPVGITFAEANRGMPLIYVNPAFETMTGYSAREAIGKNCRYLQGSDRLQPEIASIHDAISR